MVRRRVSEQLTSRLAIWARRTALFSLAATLIAIIIVRSGALDIRPSERPRAPRRATRCALEPDHVRSLKGCCGVDPSRAHDSAAVCVCSTRRTHFLFSRPITASAARSPSCHAPPTVPQNV